jgi:hypothetical protein
MAGPFAGFEEKETSPCRLRYLCIGPIRGLHTIPSVALGELGISAI